ncbi:MAG: MBL fold metallo-hydrolase [Planctomycetota bacterium]
MQIVFLGAGGYHPNSRRHTACVMVPELGVVFDAGTGSFRIAQHLVTERLDIFLSHVHLDHVFGLTSLIGLFKKDDPTRIRVHGEADKLDAIQQHLYAPQLFPVTPNFTPVPLEETIELDSTTLKSFPLVGHPGGSVGYRLDTADGKSLAYVTDTIAHADAAYVESLSGVDLLIHEAYFDDDRRDFANLTGHSCLPDVIDLAEKCGAAHLVLVHVNPRDDRDEPFDLTEARSRVPAVTLGFDGLTIDL